MHQGLEAATNCIEIYLLLELKYTRTPFYHEPLKIGIHWKIIVNAPTLDSFKARVYSCVNWNGFHINLTTSWRVCMQFLTLENDFTSP